MDFEAGMSAEDLWVSRHMYVGHSCPTLFKIVSPDTFCPFFPDSFDSFMFALWTFVKAPIDAMEVSPFQGL